MCVNECHSIFIIKINHLQNSFCEIDDVKIFNENDIEKKIV